MDRDAAHVLREAIPARAAAATSGRNLSGAFCTAIAERPITK